MLPFELVMLMTSTQSLGPVQLTGNQLYVTVVDGSLSLYTVEPIVRTEMRDESPSFAYLKTEAVKRVQLSVSKKPIMNLAVIPTESIVAALNQDGSVSFHKSDSLLQVPDTQIPPLRGVTAMCIDTLLHSPATLTIAKRKLLSVYRLDTTKLSLFKKDVSVMPSNNTNAGSVTLIVQEKTVVCSADGFQYQLVHLDSNQTIPLFPYEASQMNPVAIVIGEGEFLLVTASVQGVGLGVFISSSGDPVRGTLQWPAIPVSIVFQSPYVISLLRNNSIQIHNYMTQELVQTLKLPNENPQSLSLAHYPLDIKLHINPTALSNDSPSSPTYIPAGCIQVVVVFKHKVMGLRMVPWELQVDTFLESGLVRQAVILGEQKLMLEEESDSKIQKMLWLYQRAGLISMQQLQFQEAVGYFTKGRIPPPYLINLFTDVRPETYLELPQNELSVWINQHIGTMETIVSKNLVAKSTAVGNQSNGDSREAAIWIDAKQMLALYLSEYKQNEISCTDSTTSVTSVSVLADLDTTLLKLYAENNSELAYNLLSSNNHCIFSECESYLLNHHRYYGLGLLYKSQQRFKEALEMWTCVASGELKDIDFPGLGTVIDLLVQVQDKALVRKYAELVLRRDAAKGVSIFTTRNDGLFDSTEVIELLESYGTKSLRLYFEHLVLVQKITDPEFHTRLALLYFNEITRLSNADTLDKPQRAYLNRNTRWPTFETYMREHMTPLVDARLRFIEFVRYSTLAQVELIDNALETDNRDFFVERIAVLKKKKDYDRVLEIFVTGLRDYQSAESLCFEIGAPFLYSSVLSVSNSDSIEHETTSKYLLRLFKMHLSEATKSTSSNTALNSKREAVYILNTYAMTYFKHDILGLVSNLPTDLRLQDLSPFLEQLCRQLFQGGRKSYLVRALARGEYSQIQNDLTIKTQNRGPIRLTAEKPAVCKSCNLSIRDPTKFIVQEDGGIVHYYCSKASK